MTLSHLIAQTLWAAQYDPRDMARYVRICMRLSKRGACGEAKLKLGL